nr:MAG TPA: hypothetical protein [Caudoviricetes sp.]
MNDDANVIKYITSNTFRLHYYILLTFLILHTNFC